jgi:condensin complex subunit 2
VASCTLDASTKIYAYRVDCVHADVFKMAGGLAVANKRPDKGEGEEEDEKEESRGTAEVLRTRKRSRKVNKMCK